MTYPDQPASSPMARTKDTAKRTGAINIGNCGSGMGFPISGIRKYSANMVAGINRNIGMYQSLFLTRLGSKMFLHSSLTPSHPVRDKETGSPMRSG